MKISQKTHLRIIWAILVKEILDSIKNKMVIGVTIGIVFMMVSSQALPILLKGYAPPRAYYLDEGKSKVLKEITQEREIDLIPRDSLEDLEAAVGGSAVPVLGLEVPAAFDQSLAENTPINLDAFSIHWANAEEITQLITHFETVLGERTDHIIRIQVSQQGIYPNHEEPGFTSMIITGFVLGVMTVGIFLVPLLMMDEVENHTLDSLLLSPARPSHILIGKALAGLFFCCLAAAFMFSFTWRWVVHWDLAITAVLLGALSTIGIGLMIGAFSSQTATINLWSGLALLALLIPAFLWTIIATKLNPDILPFFHVLPSLSMSNLLQNAFSRQPDYPDVRASLLNLVGFSVVVLVVVGYRIRKLNPKK